MFLPLDLMVEMVPVYFNLCFFISFIIEEFRNSNFINQKKTYDNNFKMHKYSTNSS